MQEPFLADAEILFRRLAAGRRRARPLRCRSSPRALEVGTPVLREGAGAVRAHRGRARRALRGGREPEHAARAPGPRRRVLGRRAARRVRRALPDRLQLLELLLDRRSASTSPSRCAAARSSASCCAPTTATPGQPAVRLDRRAAGRPARRRARDRRGRPPGAGPAGDAAHASVRARDRRGRATPTARPASAATSSGLITGLALRRPPTRRGCGGNHIVADSNIPGLAGPTTAGWPGVKNLKDVP